MKLDFVTAAYERINDLKKEVFMTITQVAKKEKLSRSFVHYLVVNGKVRGAMRVGSVWVIPKHWKYKPKRQGEKHGPRPYTKALSLKDPSKRLGRRKKN